MTRTSGFVGRCAVVLGILAASFPALAGTTHAGKYVQYIQSAGAPGGCMYFMLVGVSEADPINPGNAWIAIPLSHPNAKEILMMLTVAKVAEKTVNVVTTGATACGYASVDYVWN